MYYRNRYIRFSHTVTFGFNVSQHVSQSVHWPLDHTSLWQGRRGCRNLRAVTSYLYLLISNTQYQRLNLELITADLH